MSTVVSTVTDVVQFGTEGCKRLGKEVELVVTEGVKPSSS